MVTQFASSVWEGALEGTSLLLNVYFSLAPPNLDLKLDQPTHIH